MAFPIQIQTYKYLNINLIRFDLVLNKEQLLPPYKNHPGSFGLLDWELEEPQIVEGPPYLQNQLAPKISFSEEQLLVNLRTADKPVVFLSFQISMGKTLAELDVQRTGLIIGFPLTIRAAASGTPVFQSKVEVQLCRQEGTHLLALDLGTSASCVAISSRDLGEEPQLLALQNWEVPNIFFPSAICLDSRETNDLDKQNANVQDLDMITLGGQTFRLEFGHKHLQDRERRNPAGILPSLKRMVEAPPSLWQSFGIPYDNEQFLAPIVILKSFLLNFFKNMYINNLEIWRKDVLIEEVLVTVPNNMGFLYIERLKDAVEFAINNCGSPNKGYLLADHWKVPKDKIVIIREADAAAAEFIGRSRRAGGMGSAAVGTDHAMAVLDFGAGTCDKSILRFKVTESHDLVHTEMLVLGRMGMNLGGDEMDKILAQFLFRKMMDSKLLSLTLEGKKVIFNREELADDVALPRLEKLGLFGPYRELAKNLDNQVAIEEVQNLRMRMKSFVKSLKQIISENFYNYQIGDSVQIGKISDGRIPSKILDMLFQVIESNKDHSIKELEIKKLYKEQWQNFFNTSIQIKRALPPLELKTKLVFKLEDLWNFEPYRQFFIFLTQGIVNDMLDRFGNFPKNKVLNVILTGRVLAFPMIRESLIWYCFIHKNVSGFKFPNKRFGPTEMKSAVVLGALQTHISGLNTTEFNKKVQAYFYLLCYDQKIDQAKVIKLVDGDDEFGEDQYFSGVANGVRLRRRANALESLTIVRLMEDRPDLALNWQNHDKKSQVVFNQRIERSGEFEQDRDRSVVFRLRADGYSEVILFPTVVKKNAALRETRQPLVFKMTESEDTGLWNQFPL